MENNSFITFDWQEGISVILDESNHKSFPLKYMSVWKEMFELSGSFHGYVFEGEVEITSNQNGHLLGAGSYFSGQDLFMDARRGRVIVIHVIAHKAMTMTGGPIEVDGRLKYIDGCTDSLLIPPIRKGDCCLNHLHFPKSIIQTPHTHPSHRIGIVAKGEGECVTPFGVLPLVPGCIFVIKEWDGETVAEGEDGKSYPIGTHKFNTTTSSMDVIAFHPDSDFGPEDEVHPMINRTFVDGVPANDPSLKNIRTK